MPSSGRTRLVLGPLLGIGPDGTPPSLLAALTEPDTGQGILHGALTRAVRRAAQNQPVVLLLDDAHLADPATVRWLSQAPTHVGDASVFIVVSTRLEEDLRLPGATLTVTLDPLDLEAATAIVGRERAGDLLARSGGNALFLTELAAWETTEADSDAHLPDTSAAPSRSAVPGPARREPRCTRPL